MHKHLLKLLLIAILLASTLLLGGCGAKSKYICVMNADGSNIIKLSTEKEGVWLPSWSPDGTKIAYCGSNTIVNETPITPACGIYIINSDGSNKVQLAKLTAIPTSLCWSPNSDKLVFSSLAIPIDKTREAYADIYTIDINGNNLVQLTTDLDQSWEASWSPDGTKIAFQAQYDDYTQICTMNVDGSDLIKLTNNPSKNTDPLWSPDSSKIIFNSWRDGNEEIYVMDSNGSNQTRLTDNTMGDYSYSWSPDGNTIAFVSHRNGSDGSAEIYTMCSDGGGQRRLTNNTYDDYSPNWSPDGSRIIFESRTPEETVCINTMNADGSNISQLTHNRRSFQSSFSPDGQKIVFTVN